MSDKVLITWDSAWEEYQVSHDGSTYHTDDYSDAVATAEFISKGTTLNPRNMEIVNKVPKNRRTE